jgi:hypothetical protein
MKKLLILLLLLVTSVTWGSDWVNPYDPCAARNTLSNVTPATGRAALGLGTMAVATATDYVATSALALRLDTVNASVSERLSANTAWIGIAKLFNIDSGSFGIFNCTTDGADNQRLQIGGGGGSGYDRGGYIGLYGNEHATSKGAIALVTGYTTTDYITFITGNATERVRITSGGSIGISTNTPDIATKLHVVGQVRVDGLPVYADNAAAIAGGLAAGRFYRTSTGVLMVVYTP